jgi:predicted short-subunit dehydrogenase-like oxidoreductase (DUF2520 family)
MNVTFIGSGNLAWHLAPALDNTDFAVREVYSPNAKHAAALIDKLYQAHLNLTLDFSTSKSQIFIIAASDDSIQGIAQNITLPENAILVHTSGSQPLSLLRYAPTPNTGVLYPLQTFTKDKKIELREVPFFIESENSATEKVLMSMAKAISKKVFKISSTERKALHVAAVFASNFTNHMLTIARDIADKHNVNFEFLKPLIIETINKSLAIGPEKAQTGPAKRGDLEILDSHMQFLEHEEAIAEIYKVISQHIVDRYSED